MSILNDSQFWGKYRSETGDYLPLLAHSLDVAVVFRALCDLRAIRRTLNNSTKTALTDEHFDRLAVLALLHDIGKANLGFQDKIRPEQPTQVGHIRELAPLFADEELREDFLESLPPGIGGWFPNAHCADSYLFVIFSHHGRPVRFTDTRGGNYWEARDNWWRPRKGRDPMRAIAEISAFAPKVFPRAFSGLTSPLPPEPHFHHRFAGLVMLADWLGSHSYWFPIETGAVEERLAHNIKIAPKLLKAVGLAADQFRPQLSEVGKGFTSQFDYSPLPLQKIIDGLDPQDDNTRLIIAESETGSGKTEAALNWFCKLFIAGKVDSLYFALPTRVAARELYARIDNYIKTWFPNSSRRPVTLLAVPGYTQVDGYSLKELIPDVKGANIWLDEKKDSYRERYWAGAMPKRFLAATIAVGTIDQALLSIVQTGHAHLRSVCLDRSLLVVDEVHASDLYMSQLLQALLDHHLRVGGYAALLSATLGSRALREYIQISQPEGRLPQLEQAVEMPYPSLTLMDGKRLPAASLKREKKVHFDLCQWASSPEEVIGRVLVPALRAGARVLLVLNTVARVVNLVRAVEACPEVDASWLFTCRGQICPHHGRFAPPDREVLDAAISARLGKASAPGPLLLIGTQTLEQSLDIDADLLITDLAPSDVLLQRIGRLHRHERRRPEGYAKPRCLVLVPDRPLESALNYKGEVSADFKKMGYGSVYEDLRSLELTHRTLQEHPSVAIPRDNRFLVERATHPEMLDTLTGSRWLEHGNLLQGKGYAKKIAASMMTNMFGEYFGQIEFVEAGRAVASRLGIDRLQVPLEHNVISPLGETLSEMVIPGHMAPTKRDVKMDKEIIMVKEETGGIIKLQWRDSLYYYSRYGLEEIL